MQRVHFYVGENKSIGLRIHARDQAPFTIRDATWELKGNYETEAQGECEINGGCDPCHDSSAKTCDLSPLFHL